MCELGWKSLGVLELTALPSIDKERWVPWVRETDVLLVNGGDALYLCHWMRQSGLADLLPSLRETVWVGLSAGSMVMTPRIGEDFVGWKPPTGGDSTLGIVDFSIFPHLDHESCRRTPWPTQKNGRPASRVRRTRSTIRPPSKWSTAPSKSSPRGTGSCFTPKHGELDSVAIFGPLGRRVAASLEAEVQECAYAWLCAGWREGRIPVPTRPGGSPSSQRGGAPVGQSAVRLLSAPTGGLTRSGAVLRSNSPMGELQGATVDCGILLRRFLIVRECGIPARGAPGTTGRREA